MVSLDTLRFRTRDGKVIVFKRKFKSRYAKRDHYDIFFKQTRIGTVYYDKKYGKHFFKPNIENINLKLDWEIRTEIMPRFHLRMIKL